MKKLLLAVVLLAVVVGTAYIKGTRGSSREHRAFESGRLEGQRELVTLQEDVDSLKRLLEAQRTAYADSLTTRDKALHHEIGVLVSFLDSAIGLPEGFGLATNPADPEAVPPEVTGSGEPDSSQLSSQPETAAQESTESASTAVVDSTEMTKNVLAFYGKLYEDLPKDLTPYERKVALYEISLKTAAEYSLTIAELKAICEDHFSTD